MSKKKISFKDIEGEVVENESLLVWPKAMRGRDTYDKIQWVEQMYRTNPKEARRFLNRYIGELTVEQYNAYAINYYLDTHPGKTLEEAKRYAKVNAWRFKQPTRYKNEEGQWVEGNIQDVYRSAKRTLGARGAMHLISRVFFGSL